jgi:ribosome-binding protein aMBF1 (putative translation factor)
MITTPQLRAARALLDLSQDDVSAASGLSVDDIRDAEAAAGSPSLEIAERLKRVFEAKGVVFVAAGQSDASGAGVRLHASSAEEGIRPQNLNSTNDD